MIDTEIIIINSLGRLTEMRLTRTNFVVKFKKADDEETEILNQEEDFSLPESYFRKEED